mgnify:CR=1 FL=1
MKGDGAMNEKSMKKLKEYAKESKDLYLQYSVSEKKYSGKYQKTEQRKSETDARCTGNIRRSIEYQRWRDLASDAHIKFCRS